jgi:hypothetical protein
MGVHHDQGRLPPARNRQRRERDLTIEIVAGVTQDDLVRMHGAIVAALELYPPPRAVANVFAPALHLVGAAHGTRRREALAAVIRDHLATFDTATPAPLSNGSR